jgi:two-component system chemotaxis sensor kinase CheA
VPAREFRLLQEHDSLMERQLRDLRERHHARFAWSRRRGLPPHALRRPRPRARRRQTRPARDRRPEHEIDKFLIERMMDPILHLARNASATASKTVDERVAAGKPPEGTIRLSASTVGESVVIEIATMRRGIDLAAIARALDQGLHVEDGAVDPRLLLDVICASGFSTREEADRISGRGVGMAVVRRRSRNWAARSKCRPSPVAVRGSASRFR